nr:gtpase-activating protein [Quercus suber]
MGTGWDGRTARSACPPSGIPLPHPWRVWCWSAEEMRCRHRPSWRSVDGRCGFAITDRLSLSSILTYAPLAPPIHTDPSLRSLITSMRPSGLRPLHCPRPYQTTGEYLHSPVPRTTDQSIRAPLPPNRLPLDTNKVCDTPSRNVDRVSEAHPRPNAVPAAHTTRGANSTSSSLALRVDPLKCRFQVSSRHCCPSVAAAFRDAASSPPMAVSTLQTPSRASSGSGSSYIPMTRQNTLSSQDGSRSMRASKRYSVTAVYLSMNANHRDLEIEDDLARAQKALRDLKGRISSQSKKNFVLEKDVRYLDSRIALLVQNRMAMEERDEVASHLDEASDLSEGSFPNDEKTQKYGNLLFLLQSEPRHIAHLCRLVTMAEIDQLLQTVMFTIYGNQYESREEHLLLTMFQVGLRVTILCFSPNILCSPF